MTGEPRETDPRGPFRPAEHFHYTELRHKVLNAREHGAAAVVVVEHPGRGDRPARFAAPRRPGASSRSRPGARSPTRCWLRPGSAWGPPARIDRTGAPASRALPGVRARIRSALLRDRGTTANVVGILPGADPALAAEAIVIGAHYDHLGRGSPFSLAPERGDAIHPGADDNASGTAALLGLAETLARAARRAGAWSSSRSPARSSASSARRTTWASRRSRSTAPWRWSTSTGWAGSATAGSTSWASTPARGSAPWSSTPATGSGAAGPARRRRRAVRPHRLPQPRAPGPLLLHRTARRLPPSERYLGQDRRRRAPDGHHDRLPGRPCPGRS